MINLLDSMFENIRAEFSTLLFPVFAHLYIKMINSGEGEFGGFAINDFIDTSAVLILCLGKEFYRQSSSSAIHVKVLISYSCHSLCSS